MFDNPFDFFAIVIAIVAFIFARKAMNQVAALRARLDAMETTAAAVRPVPPPLTRTYEQRAAPASPGIVPEPPPIPDVEFDRPRGSGANRRGERSRRRPTGRATAAAATRSRFRGGDRHPLGGVDRRPDAGARRILHGALFDRGRPARPRHAHDSGRRCSRWHCSAPANGPAARRASRPSRRCRSPTSLRF